MTGSAFNIHRQQAGAIYNASGTQVVYGGGQLTASFADAMSQLRAAVASAAPALSDGQQCEAARLLDDATEQLSRRDPSKRCVAESLDRLAQMLHVAGAAVGSIEAFHRLVEWLGPVAASIISL